MNRTRKVFKVWSGIDPIMVFNLGFDMKNYSVMMMSVFLTFTAQAMDLESVKSCRQQDEQKILSSKTWLEAARSSMATATAARTFLLSSDANSGKRNKETAAIYRSAISTSKSCEEIYAKIISYLDKEAQTPGAKAEMASMKAGMKKSLPSTKKDLAELGFIRASQTLTENEFNLTLSLSLSGLGQVFGNKSGGPFEDALANEIHRDVYLQIGQVYKAKSAAFDALGEKLGGNGIPVDHPEYIAINEQTNQKIKELEALISERNAALTAQEIELALIKNDAYNTIKKWNSSRE